MALDILNSLIVGNVLCLLSGYDDDEQQRALAACSGGVVDSVAARRGL